VWGRLAAFSGLASGLREESLRLSSASTTVSIFSSTVSGRSFISTTVAVTTEALAILVNAGWPSHSSSDRYRVIFSSSSSVVVASAAVHQFVRTAVVVAVAGSRRRMTAQEAEGETLRRRIVMRLGEALRASLSGLEGDGSLSTPLSVMLSLSAAKEQHS
jgi:hypothetical protein